MKTPPFAEPVAASHFSFLRGSSSPDDMVLAALAMGLAGIGIADRNSVAGVVRAHVALREARAGGVPGADRFRLIVGARLCFADGTPDIAVYPTNRAGWGQLTRLLTTGNRRAVKGDCVLTLADLLGLQKDTPLPSTGGVVSLGPAQPGLRRAGRASLPAHALPAATRPRIKSGSKSRCPSREREGDGEGLNLILLPDPNRMPTPREADALTRLAAAFPGHIWCAATMLRGGRDARRLAAVQAMAAEAGVPLIATNDALFTDPDARQLHDVMTAIREHVTVQAAGRRLARHAERHLKPAAEMARLFAAAPDAVAETQRFFAGIHFSLDQLRYEYPHEPVPPGYDAQGWLEELVHRRAAARWPDGVPDAIQLLLDEELPLIARMDYAPYFLTVHDIVAWAQARGILCQGRGSAANSAVCYVLGITAVDPAKYNLLFSRFISEERREPPDIDVDFEHERREEVIQYIYDRYGRERAGIAATVIHYRPRSAVREVGKALGLSEDVTARLASTIWGSFSGTLDEKRFAESGFDPQNPEIARVNALVQQILMFPRHLSQHVGGFVLTEGRLDELVPIHNAAMEGRTFIEWDKDDIDALGLMKVDVLALGMLTCIRKAFDLIEETGGPRYSLDSVPDDAPDVYAMLHKGDSVGVFQVESRAQMNMLPRMKPACFYDLAIQVAIVRPGPIQGDMVHPYLRRRQGREPVSFPSPDPAHGPPDELQQVLGKTLGVPLFQEQAMKLAIVAAKFTPSEANRLRRSMATFRRVGGMHAFWDKLVGGMVARGYERDFAERCFRQIEGFGSYGFPESHAIAFARLVWVSSYLKCRYPAHFAAALLNAQPMGFYAPAQIVRDAQEHGVTVLGVDVNASGWDNGIERVTDQPLPFRGGAVSLGPAQPGLRRAGWGLTTQRHTDSPHPNPSPEGEGLTTLRLGFRQIDGFREAWADAITAARASGPFTSIEDVARRADLPLPALRLLADADGFGSLGLNRRQALWDVRRTPARQLDLFAAMDAPELAAEPDPALPAMALGEHVVTDYQLLRLSLRAHPMALLRPMFAAEGVKSCAETSASRNGSRVRTAGVVLVRQRPGNGKAIFITIEDESGVTNAVLWERTFERDRRAVMTARLMLIEGEVQVSPEGIVHLMAARVIDRSADLARLSSIDSLNPPPARADEVARPQYPRGHHSAMPAPRGGHPRDVRVLPKSRDFH